MADIWEFRVPEGAGQGHIWQGDKTIVSFYDNCEIKKKTLKKLQQKTRAGQGHFLHSEEDAKHVASALLQLCTLHLWFNQ